MDTATALAISFLAVTGATVIGVALLGWVLKPRRRHRRY